MQLETLHGLTSNTSNPKYHAYMDEDSNHIVVLDRRFFYVVCLSFPLLTVLLGLWHGSLTMPCRLIEDEAKLQLMSLSEIAVEI